MSEESEWNWPLIIIFVVMFVIIGISMAIPDGVITTETCTTIGETTRCTITETYK